MERNEAIEIVKRNYPHVTESGSQFETALRTLIPELAESEDERIRKRLIDLIYKVYANTNYITCVEHEEMLAWLEKQGKKEYALKSFKDEDVHRFMEYFEKRAKDYDINLPHRGYDIYALTKDLLEWLERQGEQKPVISDDALREGIAHYGITQYQIDNWLKKYIDVEKQGEQKVSVVDFKAKDWYVSKVDGKIYNAKYMEKTPTNLARILEIEKAAMSATGIIDQEKWFIKGAKWADKNPSYISSEKQGEKPQGKFALEAIQEKEVDNTDKVEPKFKVKYAGNEYNVIEEKDIDGITFYGIEDEPNHIDYVKADTCEIINAEPKFKVGDWIITKYMHLVLQIINNDNGSYKTVETDGTERNDSYDFIESNHKLWTIQDAKDGDILVANEGPFIFKCFDKFHPECPVAYCGMDDKDNFIAYYGDGWWTDEEVEPATKEQRDYLFKKMHEAGYEWDEKKKELKKIEKATKWSEEDETYLEHSITAVKNYYTDYKGKENPFREPLLSWLKSLRPQNTWMTSDDHEVTHLPMF